METTISWNKEGFGEKDYFKDLVEAEKHAAEVAGEPNYPPRPILPEYIAPPVNLLPFLLDKSEEKSKEEKELDVRESNERSRISRKRDQMVEDTTDKWLTPYKWLKNEETGPSNPSSDPGGGSRWSKSSRLHSTRAGRGHP